MTNFKNFFIVIFYKIFRKFLTFFNISFSFSSDGEDYILTKIFNGISLGNYIDIGANHPVLHSNTFIFYLNGWKGVCVDPIPNFVNKYKFYRPNDIFISAGLSNDEKNKSLPFYYYANHPDNSTFDIKRVKVLESVHNRKPTKILDLPLISVDEIIYKFKQISSSDEVHLLNIDVEGFEKTILDTFFLKKIFPWVVCVEEIGYVAEDIHGTKINELMKKNGYKLGMRTFLSSIYIRNSIINKLKSPFTKEWL